METRMKTGIETGDVYIITNPSGAKIYMDNDLVIDMETFLPIRTPVILAIPQGYHSLTLKLNKYGDKYGDIYDAVYVFPEQIIYLYKNFNG